jgi:biopolymer transport protein ExbD
MLRVPTSRKRKKPEEKLNLVPIMDSVFIFIFFLLMSASFLKIYEIGSDAPILSEVEPPKPEKDPLALTLKLEANTITFSQGLPSRPVRKFERAPSADFDYAGIHAFLVDLKKQHLDEDTIIFQPVGEVTYEDIVKVMDAVRMMDKTDEAIFRKNKDGIDERVKDLFAKIVFSNLTN